MGDKETPFRSWPAVLLILVPLTWPHLFFKGQVPVDGNTLRLFYPSWTFLHAHPPTLFHWPLWNPFRNMGEPFLADPQSLAAYPPMWFLCRVPSYLNFVRLWILGHTLLAGYFMGKWVLRLTDDIAASVVAAIVVALNGYFMAHGTLPNHFAAAAYVPMAFYFFECEHSITLGAVLALQWLAGFPPFSLLTGLALAVWSLFAGPAKRALLWKSGLVAAGLAAFQIIPFVELLCHSSRPVFLDWVTATAFSEPWRELLRMLFVPHWFAWDPQLSGDQAVTSFYLGPFALLCSAWAVWKGAARERAFGLAVLICFVLSMGSSLPGVGRIFVMRLFRFPANWLLLGMVGMALLSGWGVSRIKSVCWKWIAAALVLADLLAFAQYVRVPWFQPDYLTVAPPLARTLRPLLKESRMYHVPVVTRNLEGRGMRGLGDYGFFKEALVPSYGMAFGLREVDSYQELKLKRARQFQDRLAAEGPSSPLARWAGISTVITRKPGNEPWGPQNIQVVSMKTYNAPVFFANGSPPARVDLSVLEPDKIVALVSADKADRLVFSGISYPGWRAFVNEQQVELEVFEDTFLAVMLPQGRHKVVFDYHPLTFRVGFWISLGVLILLGVVLFRRTMPVSVLRKPSQT